MSGASEPWTTLLSMLFGLLAVGVAVLVVSGTSIEHVPFLSEALDSTFGQSLSVPWFRVEDGILVRTDERDGRATELLSVSGTPFAM